MQSVLCGAALEGPDLKVSCLHNLQSPGPLQPQLYAHCLQNLYQRNFKKREFELSAFALALNNTSYC